MKFVPSVVLYCQLNDVAMLKDGGNQSMKALGLWRSTHKKKVDDNTVSALLYSVSSLLSTTQRSHFLMEKVSVAAIATESGKIDPNGKG